MTYTVTIDFKDGPSYSHVGSAVSKIFAIEQAKMLAAMNGFSGKIKKITCVQDFAVSRD